MTQWPIYDNLNWGHSEPLTPAQMLVACTELTTHELHAAFAIAPHQIADVERERDALGEP